MFQRSKCIRNLTAVALAALSSLAAAPGLRADECPSDLENTSGYTSLASGTSTSKQKGVEEWDTTIIRFRLDRPGVLVITGTGDDSQSALFTTVDDDPTFVDSAPLGTELDSLTTVAAAGDYCVQLRPPGSASGDFELVVAYTDICDLNGADDHGDNFACATPIAVDGNDEGEIESDEPADVDVFSFVLASAATVTIESSGSTDVDGSLFSSIGGPIASDADSGSGDNFQIVQYLTAGTYYIRVEGELGEYGISLAD